MTAPTDEPAGDAPAPRRPLTVAIAVVALMVLVVFGVVEGALILMLRYDPDIVASGLVLPISLAGVAGILGSLLIGAVVAAVWRGSRGARWTITILALLALGLDVVTVVDSPDGLWWTSLDAVVYVYVLVALWAGRRTAAFFSRRSAAAETA